MDRARALLVVFVLLLCSITAAAEAAAPSSGSKPALARQVAAANVDFNGDGWADLAIGVPGETIGSVFRAGAVEVLYGSSKGLTARNSQFWSQDSPGIAGRPEADELFGTSVAAADFDGDGFSDLAIGVPWETIGTSGDAGMVHVLYGSPAGLQAMRSQTWTQNSAGIRGAAEPGDMFGLSLAAASLGRGAQSDLAIGAPGEGVGETTSSGVVHVLYGSTDGLSARGSQLWSQNSAGISDTAEQNDRFGLSLAAANLGRSSVDDLAIGVPDEGFGTVAFVGAVHVLYGSTDGVTAAGSQFWTQASKGIVGRREGGDQFGSALVAADFGRSRYADLGIGVPFESLSSVSLAGSVHVLYGSSSGLSATGSQVWNQRTAGVPGTAQAFDVFGWALAAGDFGGSTRADLAIGVPGESDTQDWFGAGAVQVLLGSATGLSTAGNQVFDQDTPGIGGKGEPVDRFGSVLAGGNFDGNAKDDLAVGDQDENVGGVEQAGNVNVIPGTLTGLTSAGSQVWTQNSQGIADDVEAWDNFGASLTTG